MAANNNLPAAAGNTALARPSVASHTPLAKVRTIADAIDHPELKMRLAEALPRHMSAERMLRVFALSLQRTPDLAKADLRSLLGALIGFGALGIEPNTPLGHGYLIPFAKRAKNDRGAWETVGYEVQAIVGYKGYIDLARRTGDMVSIHPDVVYKGDHFDYQYGTDEFLRHKYGERGGEMLMPTHAYACAKLDGGYAFEVMVWSDVMRIRDGSQGYQHAKRVGGRTLETTPWVAHTEAMARKTPIRRLAKVLPMSIEVMTAVAIDERSERRGVRWDAMLEADPAEARDALAYVGDEGAGEDAGDQAEPEEGARDGVQPDPVSPPPPPAASREEARPASPPPARAKAAAKPKPAPAAAPPIDVQDWDGEIHPRADSKAAAAKLIELCDAATTIDQLNALWMDNATARGRLAPADLEEFKHRIAAADTRINEGGAVEGDADGDGEAGPWAVDIEALKDGDGGIDWMAAVGAIEDMIGRCAKPEDYSALMAANGNIMAGIKSELSSLHKKLAAQIEAGIKSGDEPQLV